MSSLRNAVKRITHKERSQPQSRQKLGLLEKKKDYKQRAVDYHCKEDRIKAMKQKAAMRNPDEFYFGMHNSQIKGGKHTTNANNNSSSGDDYRSLDPELVKVMKSQDLSYVRMQKQKDTKRAERLQATLQIIDDDRYDGGEAGIVGRRKRKHTMFVDSQQEAEEFDVAKHFDTVPEMAHRTFNRLRKGDVEKLIRDKASIVNGCGLKDADDDKDSDKETSNRSIRWTRQELQKQAQREKKQAKILAKARSKSYNEMEARRQRAEAMHIAEEHLVTEKLVTGKGQKRKIKPAEDGRPAQYKWRRKRLL